MQISSFVYRVTGFAFAMLAAMVSYKLLPFSHHVNKAIHTTCHSMALILVSAGLYAVAFYNNNNKINGAIGGNDDDYNGAYQPALDSMHDIMGLTTLALFYSNYVFGILIFDTCGYFSMGIR